MSPGRSFFESNSASDFLRRGAAEIDHDWNPGERARLDGPITAMKSRPM